LTGKPLMERKKILSESVKEGNNLSISRYIEQVGKAFFELVKQQNLEGIVAKKKNGLYYIGKRTREWVKIKIMQYEDLLVLGYKPDERGNVKDLVVGFMQDGKPKCKGTLYLGVNSEERKIIKNFAEKNKGEPVSAKYKGVIWMKPKLTGTVYIFQCFKRTYAAKFFVNIFHAGIVRAACSCRHCVVITLLRLRKLLFVQPKGFSFHSLY